MGKDTVTNEIVKRNPDGSIRSIVRKGALSDPFDTAADESRIPDRAAQAFVDAVHPDVRVPAARLARAFLDTSSRLIAAETDFLQRTRFPESDAMNPTQAFQRSAEHMNLEGAYAGLARQIVKMHAKTGGALVDREERLIARALNFGAALLPPHHEIDFFTGLKTPRA